jgi:predicted protein tyrosine phosphatase
LDEVLVHWADELVVMDNKQEKVVKTLLSELGYDKPVYNLNVPDNYEYRQPELVELLEAELPKYFKV